MTTELKDTIYVVETPQCGICNEAGTVEITLQEYLCWEMGMLIQDAMPNVSPEIREQLKTGTHPKCYKEMLGQ